MKKDASKKLKDSIMGVCLGYITHNGGKKEIILQDSDRFNHLYMIGQTGTGKSTMILKQAISDIQRGYGICVFDTYGDLAEKILQYYPKERLDDLIYFDLSNTEYPVAFNPLDGAKNDYERDLLTNDMVELFVDMYGSDLFGPRIQDYFRNACLLLMEQPKGGTLLDIMSLFTDDTTTGTKIGNIKNPIIASWWDRTYKKMGDREKAEIIPFIQAKISQFTTSKYIQNIIGQSKSSFNFEQILKEKKVIICKFPRGIVGESNVKIMCKLLLMQLQQAILKRINIPEKERTPFFIYMDDFYKYLPNNLGQFLIDATKYNIGIVMTNQYLDQLRFLKSDISNVILNNVGTILTFRVGDLDAEYLENYFSKKISKEELKMLENNKGFIKVCSKGIQGKPFVINTDINLNKNIVNKKEKVEVMKTVSGLKWGMKREIVDKEINYRIRN